MFRRRREEVKRSRNPNVGDRGVRDLQLTALQSKFPPFVAPGVPRG